MKTDKAELIAELKRAIKATSRVHIYDRDRWVPAVAIKKKTIRAMMELLKRCLKYVIITRHEIIDIGMENYYRTDELLNDLRKAVGCTCSNPLWHDAGCQIDREIDSSETE